MKDDTSSQPIFSSYISGERMVYAWKSAKVGGYQEVHFPISSVERVERIDDKSTMIVLPSGLEIPVDLSLKGLEQKIWSPNFKEDDMGILDLREVTGRTAAIREKEAAAQRAREVEEAFRKSIGEATANGIFLGKYEPKDRNGVSLGKIFNVSAAPEDLTDESGKKSVFKYVKAVKRIAELKNWHGFDGTNYATDKELYQALKNGSYDGGWIIPTRDLLSGKDVNGNMTQPDNLYANKDKGAFAGTFCTAASSGSDFPDWYWSSTEYRVDSSYVRGVLFSDGDEIWNLKDNRRLSCRPVRLVAASSAPAPV